MERSPTPNIRRHPFVEFCLALCTCSGPCGTKVGKLLFIQPGQKSTLFTILRIIRFHHDEINQNSWYRNEGGKPVATVYWNDRALRY
jgi:hypothetical protein